MIRVKGCGDSLRQKRTRRRDRYDDVPRTLLDLKYIVMTLLELIKNQEKHNLMETIVPFIGWEVARIVENNNKGKKIESFVSCF